MKTIRIGTRHSNLAMWQAHKVSAQLQDLGYKTEIVKISSEGDKNIIQPIYRMGITGVFTRTLDAALLEGKVDVAVHSLKDVPTILPEGIIQYAVLERGSTEDVLVSSGTAKKDQENLLLTGSLRRKAQWLRRYPDFNVQELRGNVNLRLEKVEKSSGIGGVFAKAGLERLGLLPEDAEILDWIIPAPSQGAVVVVGLENDAESCEACSRINHRATEISVAIEREFLRILQGGCTAPIGGKAEWTNDDTINFVGVVHSLDGKTELKIEESISKTEYEGFGERMAKQLIARGADKLIAEIKKELGSDD